MQRCVQSSEVILFGLIFVVYSLKESDLLGDFFLSIFCYSGIWGSLLFCWTIKQSRFEPCLRSLDLFILG